METLGIRTKKSWAGPGMDAFDAELVIWDEKFDSRLYIHVNQGFGNHYTVADYSVFDYLTGETKEEPNKIGEYMEEYEQLTDAIQSKYLDGFILLDNILNEMQGLTYGHRESIYSYIVSDIEWDDEYFDEDNSEYMVTTTGEFLYQSKSMTAPVKRQVKGTATVETKTFQMIDENGVVIESFDDVEAAEKSKWSLLYKKIDEELDSCL